ncbi:GGDEF domain-containing protein [Solibacillus sp. FSL K6-1523]|uniref:GGDEF domain-containing protein n=1 Tax=Solibacillus sp. FSL K6-1523 TaxID=2921471 RepID=UPI0030F6305C
MTMQDFNQAFNTIEQAFDEARFADVLEHMEGAIELGILENERFAVAKLFDLKINSYMFIDLPARGHDTLTEFHTFIEQYETVEGAIWFHLCAANLWANGSSAVDGIVERHVKKALAYGAQTADPNLKRRVYGTTATYLMNIGEYERACDYLELAFFYAQLVAEQEPQKESLIYSTVIDLIYLNTMLKRYDIAKSVNAFVYNKIDLLSGRQKGVIIQNYGFLLMQQGQDDKAIEEFQKLAAYTDEFKDTSLKAIAYQYMCECMENIAHPDLVEMLKIQVKVLNDLLDERETEYALEVETKIQQTQFLKKASTDVLTDVYNRAYFDAEAQKLLSQLDGSTYALLAMIDLDFFKQINDQHGHLVGDEALATVGSGLKTFALQQQALVARYGGDEFLLICTNSDQKLLERFAQAIHSGLSALTVEADEQLLALGFSVGVTIVKEPAQLNDVLKQADEALYYIKNNGRGHYAFYNQLPEVTYLK